VRRWPNNVLSRGHKHFPSAGGHCGIGPIRSDHLPRRDRPPLAPPAAGAGCAPRPASLRVFARSCWFSPPAPSRPGLLVELARAPKTTSGSRFYVFLRCSVFRSTAACAFGPEP
jgi:hypothetical protein